MASGLILLVFLTAQRIVELVIAQRNTKRLLARGAQEHGAEHYPLMVGFHASWLALMWWLGFDADLQPFWVGVFVLLQGFRLWILWSLGPRWTTRIIILNEPLVKRGPYRWMKHPNYALVIAEIAVVPLALGAPLAAVILSALHAVVLTIRIRAENRALETIGAPSG